MKKERIFGKHKRRAPRPYGSRDLSERAGRAWVLGDHEKARKLEELAARAIEKEATKRLSKEERENAGSTDG